MVLWWEAWWEVSLSWNVDRATWQEAQWTRLASSRLHSRQFQLISEDREMREPFSFLKPRKRSMSVSVTGKEMKPKFLVRFFSNPYLQMSKEMACSIRPLTSSSYQGLERWDMVDSEEMEGSGFLLMNL